MNRIGTIVTPETIGNITRPPYRSVSAPTTMRPSEPTTTGTATSSATSDSLSVPSVPVSRNSGPSGLISAQAQKFTANPIVAIASISHGDLVAVPVRGSEVDGVVTVVPLARAARLPPWPSTVDLPTGWVMSGLLTGPPRDGWGRAATSAVDPRTSRQGRRSRPPEATGPLGRAAQPISQPTSSLTMHHRFVSDTSPPSTHSIADESIGAG